MQIWKEEALWNICNAAAGGGADSSFGALDPASRSRGRNMFHFRNVAVHISAPKLNSNRNNFRYSLLTKIGRRGYKSYGFYSYRLAYSYRCFEEL